MVNILILIVAMLIYTLSPQKAKILDFDQQKR